MGDLFDIKGYVSSIEIKLPPSAYKAAVKISLENNTDTVIHSNRLF